MKLQTHHLHTTLAAVTAGFLAVLISYAGPLVIFFQAAQAGHVSQAMLSSWIAAISIGAAISGLLLSWKLKMPIITAWSAPGTALLLTMFPALPLAEAVAAYITAASLIFLIGWSGYFDRLIVYLPKGLASGMLAGILFQFGVNAFKSILTAPLLALGMLLSYLLFRRLLPRYCILLVLLTGIVLTSITGSVHLTQLHLILVQPQFIAPHWGWQSTLSLAIPLVLVSLSGQFLPGMAILRVSGYQIRARPILLVTSLSSLCVAFFGGITIVIAAITAAICTGPDAHEDPAKRYIAGLSNGLFYLLGALCSGSIVLLYNALPKEFVSMLAGLALLGAISNNLLLTMQEDQHREAAVITFLATASGMQFLGLGSAFWGIVIGSIAYWILHARKPA